MSKTAFAKKISRSRSDVNDILKRKSIDTQLLIEISKILDYDFIHNIYYKGQTDRTLFISVKTEAELLEKWHLFEKFIHFLKNKI